MGSHPWCGTMSVFADLVRSGDAILPFAGRFWCSMDCAVERLHGTAAPAIDMQRAYPAPTIIDEVTEMTPEAYKYLAIKADAKRLAELREEKKELTDRLVASVQGQSIVISEPLNHPDAVAIQERRYAVACLIAVYEECQARGLRFGGGS